MNAEGKCARIMFFARGKSGRMNLFMGKGFHGNSPLVKDMTADYEKFAGAYSHLIDKGLAAGKDPIHMG